MKSVMPKKLGVAIFGLGRAGKIHTGNVARNISLDLLYVVDLLTDMAQTYIDGLFQSQCKVVSPDKMAEVLADSRLDFVVVGTPTHQHEEIVLAALRAGKGVFCEKPIAATEESVINCYNEAELRGVPLFCSFNRRYDPSLRLLHQTKGKVGQIQMVKSCARDAPLPPMAYLAISGGVYHDCLVHDIDLICWLVGEWPSYVYSSAHSFVPDIGAMNDVDTVAAVMKFPSGTVAIIDTSRDAQYGYDQRIEVFGSKGMLKNENQRPNNLSFESVEGASTGRMYNSFTDRYALSYINALEHFCKVLQGEADIEITKETTLNVSKIASAMEESSRSGKQIDTVF